jgi:predicted  nucleic acid-binding Zn-ribbon protein
MSVIANLLNLNRVDAQVRGLRSRLDSANRYLTTQSRLHGELNQQLEEALSRKRQTQAKIANFEVETASINERTEKLRGELNSAVNNKQYSAVLLELNTVKEARNAIEAKVIEQMEHIEKLDGQIAGLQAQLAERARLRDVAQKEYDQRVADVGQRLEELEEERRVAAEAVPDMALKLFNEMANCYDGEAMAQIQEVDRRNREYACGACHMHMPFEAISVLLTGSDQVVRCTACGRILYLQEETRGALAKK